MIISYDDYLMSETRRKPTTGIHCPTCFDQWRRIFYMPRYRDTAGHTKAFIYPAMDDGEGSQSAPAQGRFEPLTCRSHSRTRHPLDHNDGPKSGGSVIHRTLPGEGGSSPNMMSWSIREEPIHQKRNFTRSPFKVVHSVYSSSGTTS